MIRRRYTFDSLMTIAMLGVLAPAGWADLEIDWWTVDAGGDMWSTGGEFELCGTAGQPDATVTAMTGGSLELTGGFWVIGSTGATCPGDLDGDGDTDQGDLGILLADWGCAPPNDCPGDLDGDGHTDQADLGILLADWGCGT
jgi:hypothetical protein